MKHLFFITFFCCAAQNLQSQVNNNYCWHPQTSGTTNTLFDVFFTDSQKGWAVGDSGTILHTTNGGNTWSPQMSGTLNLLSSVYFINDTTGWAVSPDGPTLYTSNGGLDWEPQPPGGLSDIHFVNDTTGWGVTAGGGPGAARIRYTSNGGMSWEAQWVSPGALVLIGIHFINDTTGWAVGGFPDIFGGGSIGKILHTSNGEEWVEQYLWSSIISDVHFVNDSTGWVVGLSDTILHTTDGGDNWLLQPSGDTSNSFWDVHFVNDKTGWAVGGFGTIVHTSNGGGNWVKQTSGSSNTLNGVYFSDTNNGWAVGDSGTILKYSVVPSAAFTSSVTGATVSFTNTSANADSFFWDFGDGDTSTQFNPTHTYPDTGTYSVTLTATNVCGDTSTFVQEIGITVGISELEFLDVFNIYPNPAGDYFTLHLEGEPRQDILVELFGSTGQTVFREALDFQSGSVLKNYSCRDVPAGMYLVRVSDAQGSVLRKIIIE